jgi:glyoxylase-like metal-dependent hydrolase (beta-lactamase superfamily II)
MSVREAADDAPGAARPGVAAGDGAPPALPAAMRFVERDWLSSNLYLFFDGEGDEREATVVDTGYHTHAALTLALVERLLAEQGLPMSRLRRIVNTHLHSDHCGGNAALARASGARTIVPASQLDPVRRWDEDTLTFRDFCQHCDRFEADEGLAAGDEILMGGMVWRALAAPGHDPDSLVLHCPQARLLISADALWDNGFGVIFPELTGESGFAEQRAVLDAIGALSVDVALPGHGPLIADVPAALARARSRLEAFVADPRRSPRNAIKVMVKFMMLSHRCLPLARVLDELAASRTIGGAAAQLGLPPGQAVRRAIDELLEQRLLALADGELVDI